MTSWLILSPRGMVFVAHGVGEYMGRYEKLGEILAENGILMFGHDQGVFGIYPCTDGFRSIFHYRNLMKNEKWSCDAISKQHGDSFIVKDAMEPSIQCSPGRRVAESAPPFLA